MYSNVGTYNVYIYYLIPPMRIILIIQIFKNPITAREIFHYSPA